jgi:hypothetical protein
MNQTSRSFRDVRILSTADFLQEEAQVHSFIHSFMGTYHGNLRQNTRNGKQKMYISTKSSKYGRQYANHTSHWIVMSAESG